MAFIAQCPTCKGTERVSPLPGVQWCPVCKDYHTDPGQRTDAGELVRMCPLLPTTDPRNIAANYAR